MGIIRFFEVDIEDTQRVDRALMRIKGISFSMAHAIIEVSGMDPNKKFADMSEDDLKKLEEIIRNPQEHGIPEFLLNRRRDYWTNESKHIVASDINMVLREDVRRLKKTRSYRGIRHESKLPLRGQRTRSTHRRNKKTKLRKK